MNNGFRIIKIHLFQVFMFNHHNKGDNNQRLFPLVKQINRFKTSNLDS